MKIPEELKKTIEQDFKLHILRADTSTLKIVDTYKVGAATVYIGVKNSRGYYVVDEPSLNPEEQQIYGVLINSLFYALRPRQEGEDPVAYIRKNMEQTAKSFEIEEEVQRSYDKFIYYLRRDAIGYNILDVLIRDTKVEEISVPAHDIVQVIHREHGELSWLNTNIKFQSEEDFRSFVQRLAQRLGKNVTVAIPFVDIIMEEGHRVAATYGNEITLPGTSLEIRKFPENPLTIVDLLQRHALTPLMAAYLWLLIEHRGFIITAGPMGSGKTTIINSLATLIPPNEKIATVEDTPELKLYHRNWQHFKTRTSLSLAETKFDVSLFDLVRIAMRYNPDHIIVGEVRGEEISALVQAAASVAAETPVLVRRNGRIQWLPISELIDPYYKDGEEWAPKFVDGIEILTVKGGRVKFEKVRYLLRHRIDEVYSVSYPGGHVRTTGSHSVYVINDRGELVPRRVDQLTAGDLLVSFSNSHIERAPLEKLVQEAPSFDLNRVTPAGNGLSTVHYRPPGVPDPVWSSPREQVDMFLDSRSGPSDPDTASALSWLGKLNGRTVGATARSARARKTPAAKIPVEPVKTLWRLLNPPPTRYSSLFERDQALITKREAKEVVEWALQAQRSPISKDAQRVVANIKRLIRGDIVSSRIDRIVKERYHGYVYDVSVPGTEMFFGGTSPILLSNTGHGSICSFHAENPQSALVRMASPPLNVSVGGQQLISAIVMLAKRQLEDGTAVRRVIEISEIVPSPGQALVNKIFYWTPKGDAFIPDSIDEVLKNSYRLKAIQTMTGWTDDELKVQIQRRIDVLEKLTADRVTKYSEIAKTLQGFYFDRDGRKN